MRPVTSRKTESASASSIARSRPASSRVTFHSSRGLLVEHLAAPARTARPSTLDGSSARAIAERGPSSSMPSSPNRSPGSISADDALAPVDRVGDGDRDPAGRDDVERVGRIALVEQHVAADERRARAGRRRRSTAVVVGASAKKSVRRGRSRCVRHMSGVTVLRWPHDRLRRETGVDHRRRRWFRRSGSAPPSSTSGSGDERVHRSGSRRVAESVSDGVVVVVAGRRRRARSAAWPAARRAASRCAPGWRPCRTTPTIVCVHDAARPLRRADAVPASDRRRPRRRRRRRAGVAGDATRSRSSTATASVVATPTGRRWSPSRRRRRSGPTCCASAHAEGGEGTDDAVARRGDRLAGWSPLPGERRQPQDHRPAPTSTGRRRRSTPG